MIDVALLVVVLAAATAAGLACLRGLRALPTGPADALLFGAGDFSHRIGKAGKLDAPEVVDARKRVAAAALRHGKFAMAAGFIAPFPELVAEGYRLFNIGADVIALTAYVKQRLEFLSGQAAALPAESKLRPRSPYA